jgi:hypothetical protein
MYIETDGQSDRRPAAVAAVAAAVAAAAITAI